MNNERLKNFDAVANQTILEKRPVLPVGTRVTPLTSEELFIRDALVGVSANVEETLARMVIDTNASSSCTDGLLSAQLKRLVLNKLKKMLRTLAILKAITDATLDNPRFIAPVADLVGSEHNRPTNEQAKTGARCRRFVE